MSMLNISAAVRAVSMGSLTADNTRIRMRRMLGHVTGHSRYTLSSMNVSLSTNEIVAIIGMSVLFLDGTESPALKGDRISVSRIINVDYRRAIALDKDVLIGKSRAEGEAILIVNASDLAYSVSTADVAARHSGKAVKEAPVGETVVYYFHHR